MAKFTIEAHERVLRWQEVTYEVEADSLEEAMEKIKAKPMEHAIGTGEQIYDGEEVKEIDFTKGSEDGSIEYTIDGKEPQEDE